MRISPFAKRAALFTTIFLAWMGAASAQPVAISSSSVEWLAATSPSIVRAVIDDISVHDRRDSINRYQTVSVRVLETIKGEHIDRQQFVHNGDFGTFRLTKLQESQRELLLILEPWMQNAHFGRSTGGYAYARFPYVVKNVAILTPQDVRFSDTSVPPLTWNLTSLSTPAQLTGAIRAYLQHHHDQDPLRRVTIELPPHLRGGAFRVDFTFPADADVDRRQAADKEPVVDFATFKGRFAKQPPTEKKPPYARNRGGYIGVYALEWMAADCDVIVRGVIEDSCFVAATDDPTGPSCGVQMRVLETLKGKAQPRVNVYVSDARDLDALQREQQEVVVFLNTQLLTGPAAAIGCQTRGTMLWDDSVIVLNQRDAEVLFADLTWHREPDEILNRLRVVTERERADSKAGKAKLSRQWNRHELAPNFDVHPPASIAAGSSLAGNDHSVIYLPVDQNLEANAKKWATADNKDLRWLAARAMIYFKSDKNAALLRTLLNDEGTWSRLEMLHLIQPVDSDHRPEFLVRWEAWHVLDGWGYDIPQPNFQTSRRIAR